MANPNPRPRLDTHNPRSKAGQRFLKIYRPVYHAFGFQKGYNFPFYFITVGTLFGFVLARMEYLDFVGTYLKNTIPGEQFWYRSGHRGIGIRLHLVGVLFGGLLACFQFTPIIRHKFRWLHRICGYLAIICLIIGIIGAFMVLDHAVGGEPSTQAYFGALGAAIIGGLLIAYINIKRLQIDQHRAWMIRSWSWAASIITLRLILLMAITVMTTYGHSHVVAIPCNEIFFMYQYISGIPDQANPTAKIYPACAPNPATSTTPIAIISSGNGPENAAAMIRSVFGMCGWLATTIHILLTELYLWLTPEESYRLRKISYERQIEKGFRIRGQYKDAGIGSTRFGDAPEWWSLPEKAYQAIQHAHDARKDMRAMQDADIETLQKPHYRQSTGSDRAFENVPLSAAVDESRLHPSTHREDSSDSAATLNGDTETIAK